VNTKDGKCRILARFCSLDKIKGGGPVEKRSIQVVGGGKGGPVFVRRGVITGCEKAPPRKSNSQGKEFGPFVEGTRGTTTGAALKKIEIFAVVLSPGGPMVEWGFRRRGKPGENLVGPWTHKEGKNCNCVLKRQGSGECL